MNKKIVVFCIDALELELVERWNLNGLHQLECGKIRVPIHEEFGQPYSPQVWASFLTGHVMEPLKFEYFGIREFIWRLLVFFRKRIPVSLGLARRVKGVNEFPKLRHKTFLETINATEINMPYYSFDNKAREMVREFAKKNISIERVWNDLYELFKKRKKQFISGIRKQIKSSDLVVAYTHILDSIQHIFYSQPEKIEKFYREMDKYVSFLKTFLPKEILFIIVSDHGFNLQEGTHSDYAFYSSNKVLSPKPTDITDFYKMFCGEDDLCGGRVSEASSPVIVRSRLARPFAT